MSDLELALLLMIIAFFMQDYKVKALEKRVTQLEKE